MMTYLYHYNAVLDHKMKMAQYKHDITPHNEY